MINHSRLEDIRSQHLSRCRQRTAAGYPFSQVESDLNTVLDMIDDQARDLHDTEELLLGLLLAVAERHCNGAGHLPQCTQDLDESRGATCRCGHTALYRAYFGTMKRLEPRLRGRFDRFVIPLLQPEAQHEVERGEQVFRVGDKIRVARFGMPQTVIALTWDGKPVIRPWGDETTMPVEKKDAVIVAPEPLR